MHNMRIGVIGGGIAGLSAAIACAQRGWRVHLFEHSSEISEVGAGLQISLNGLRVLDALGIGKHIDSLAMRPRYLTLHRAENGYILFNARQNLNQEKPYYQLHRADLIALLHERALEVDVKISLNSHASLSDLTPQDGHVFVGQNSFVFDRVIVADGVYSNLSQALLNRSDLSYSGYRAWRALVSVESDDDYWLEATRVFMGREHHIVTYPVRQNKFINIIAVEKNHKINSYGWNDVNISDQFHTSFPVISSELRALFSRVLSPRCWGIYTRAPLSKWHIGRVCLIGDAAHPMLPYMAQGACMALEDAWALAACYAKTQSPEDAGAFFYTIRHKRVERVQKTSQNNGRLFHFKNPMIRNCLHLGMLVMGRFFPQFLIKRYAWIYDYDVTNL